MTLDGKGYLSHSLKGMTRGGLAIAEIAEHQAKELYDAEFVLASNVMQADNAVEGGSNNDDAAKGAPPTKKPKLAQHLRRDPEMDNYAFLGRAPQKEIKVGEAPKTEWERYLAVEE